MAGLDAALIGAAAAAREATKEAKRERARTTDMLVELLLERAAYRSLVQMALPFLYTAPARSDIALVPSVIAQELEELLGQ